MPELDWSVDGGVGYLPMEDELEIEHFAKSVAFAQTSDSERLTAARLEFVARHWAGMLVDVGIGGGQFVEQRPNTFGFDTDPVAVVWLNEQAKFIDPYARDIPAASFWGSLDRIEDPTIILGQVTEYCFVSIPIFTSRAHVLRSPHFKPAQWYFTENGFLTSMDSHGWQCEEVAEFESDLGREDVLSFAFKRRG